MHEKLGMRTQKYKKISSHVSMSMHFYVTWYIAEFLIKQKQNSWTRGISDNRVNENRNFQSIYTAACEIIQMLVDTNILWIYRVVQNFLKLQQRCSKIQLSWVYLVHQDIQYKYLCFTEITKVSIT